MNGREAPADEAACLAALERAVSEGGAPDVGAVPRAVLDSALR